MTWLNPWAWAGLVAAALPLLIHLLDRARARTQRFPTLRFIEPSRLLPRRFSRPYDPLLLAVRVAIFVAAVAALARPALTAAGRTRDTGDAVVRAIVVDTSASLQRAAPVGGRAIDAARREADRLSGEARAHVVLETDAPGTLIAGAAAWLSRQGGRGELVVISDFQRGALDARDLATVPPAIGVRLARIGVAPAEASREAVSRVSLVDVVARITPGPERTDVEWRARRASAGLVGDDVLLLAGSTERSRADAALAAARSIGSALPVDGARAVAIVFPQYEGREALLRRERPPREPWMAEFLARLGADSLVAAQDTLGGRERLVLFAGSDAGSLASAALMAGVDRARSAVTPMGELEPAMLSATTLAAWERAPAADAQPGATAAADENGDASDGRWLWVLALLLLGLETWMRRPPREQAVSA